MAGAAIDVDAEVPDLLAQCVAIEAEQFGGLDLVAAQRRHRRHDQRVFDLGEHPLVEAGRRQAVAEGSETVQIALLPDTAYSLAQTNAELAIVDDMDAFPSASQLGSSAEA